MWLLSKAERLIKGVAHHDRRYYISSLQGSAGVLNEAVRAHWGVENELHWVLDVAFQEDASRVRVGESAQNFTRVCAAGLCASSKIVRYRRTSVKIGFFDRMAAAAAGMVCVSG